MRIHPIPITILFCLYSVISFSQKEDSHILRLRSGDVSAEKNITPDNVKNFTDRLQKINGKSFAVLQFEQLPTEATKKQLAASGIQLLEYIPKNAYTICITRNLDAGTLQNAGVRSLLELSPEQKMHPSMAKGIFPSWTVKTPGMVDVWVSFPKTISFDEIKNLLREKNVEITSTQYSGYSVIGLRIIRNRLDEIASFPFIEYIEPAPHGDQLLNIESRSNSRANILNGPLVSGGYNLKGEGVTVGIGDNSDIHYHIDFSYRYINRSHTDHSYHGTHVAGTIGAAGIRMEEYRGYAPRSILISQVNSGIINNAPAYVADFGMVITNNSYGAVLSDCSYMGYYDLQSHILDLQTKDYPTLQHIFAAGNDGELTCSPYPLGFRTVLSGFQSSKNVLTVGAIEKDKNIASFSSRGPVQDGRIKPEITATGKNTISTIPWNIHGNSSGTSMAAPAVTGGSALLYQYYRQQNSGANPKSGLIKALLCNGADDYGNAGPDYTYGFGVLNLLRSIDMLQNNRYFISSVTTGIENTQTISIPSNIAQLKVMLYWNDPAAPVFAPNALVNDLDLELVNPSSTAVLPLVLDNLPSNVNNTAIHGEDHLNNIEQVVINNPTTGTYTIKVKGTSVAQNSPQEYFVVYDYVPISTRLTYPLGGEAFSPGETALIEWDSYGDPANTFTLEYSLDNGSTWTTISSTIPATIRSYSWTVPNVQTDHAIIRLTKNSTSQISTSLPMVILGIPTITVSATQCQGYFAFDWTNVIGATDYEVFMLQGDEMTSVGTTSSTNYTLGGLDKDSIYWVSVRARLNTNPGRRAIAESRQPNSGTCVGPISDNDLLLDAIVSPNSGRVLTSTALTNATQISARIKNLDDADITSFKIRYSLDGGTNWTEETVNTNLSPGATYTHTFSTTADFSSVGSYEIRVEVINLTGADPISSNNLLIKNFRQLQNDALNLSTVFVDNMEAASRQDYINPYIGLNGIDRYDFMDSESWGRARTFVNTGIAYSGSKAITMDFDGNYSGGVTNYLTGTFNLTSYNTSSNDLRLDFQFKNHGQTFDPAHPYNKVWIRGNDLQPWIEVYDLVANQDIPGRFKRSSSIELSDILAANSQNYSSSFQVKWGQFGHVLAADNDDGEGYTFDDIRLYEAVDDIQITTIDEPIENSCFLGSNTTVKVTVKNNSVSSISNIPIKMIVDGGVAVVEIIPGPLAANASIQYIFATKADLSVFGNHTVFIKVEYASDNFNENDTLTRKVFNAPLISSFPHIEHFENNDGYWHSSGINNSWEYGAPASLKINKAASGTKAWKTKLVGNYNDLETSYLYSPCYNITGMTSPTLSLNIALDLEDCGSIACDGAWIEYSADGISWIRLGDIGAGTNWYNKNYSGNKLWSVQNYTRWHVVTTPLPTIPTIRFRIGLESDPFVNFEGVAIDDVHVYDNTMGIYDGITMGSPVSQNISSGVNNWVHFTSGGKLVASIHPNNQQMDNTLVQAYINTAGVRNDGSQYYHDRNITIKPDIINFSDSVTVRFYFLDSETENLLNATGCVTCTKPSMVSELGVTKYSDVDDNFENGILTDDIQGTFNFLSADWNYKIPFDKGYYVEFKTKDFSEFWLNNGGVDKQSPLPVELVSFTAKKKDKDVLTEWRTAMEQNISYFEVEVAKGNDDYQNGRFVKVGEVASPGNSNSPRNYTFTDKEVNKTGVRYYRLKIVDRDNTFLYSPVRAVVFKDEIRWQVYPNPSSGIYNLIYQLGQGQTLNIKIYDINGKEVKQMGLIGNGFIQKMQVDLKSERFPSGIYLLLAEAGDKKYSTRLIKQ